MVRKDRSPGPAAHNIHDFVGKESPAYSFGTMKRPPLSSASLSPGPVYLLRQSVGRQKDVVFRHNPTFGFGTSERPDPAGQRLGRNPGPGEYDVGVVVGPVKPPPYRSAPSYGFGTSARIAGEAPVPKRLDRNIMEKLDSVLGGLEDTENLAAPVKDLELEGNPGPGQYDETACALKRQPAYSFGTSAQRVGPNARANRLPGPGQYKVCETTGENTAPTHRKAPAFRFGTTKLGMRFRDAQFPGPGSYSAPSAFDYQVASVRRTLPKFTFGTSPRETGIYD